MRSSRASAYDATNQENASRAVSSECALLPVTDAPPRQVLCLKLALESFSQSASYCTSYA
jgi:hypothetical protein